MLQLILENVNTGIETVMWSSNLTLIDWWQRACVDLPDQVSLQAIFQATRNMNETNQGHGADMAIDDVKLNSGSCGKAEKDSPVYPTECSQGDSIYINEALRVSAYQMRTFTFKYNEMVATSSIC